MTRKTLARLYGMEYATFWLYYRKHLKAIDARATRIEMPNGTKRKLQSLNARQIKYIVSQIMQDPPEGYKCVNGRLIKLEDGE